ncbi:protein CASP-like [Solanum tuberosum]|uniref:protein CASP-like n=1 Tax=Solanum tuberosum TaxID=4113 RepID=UPI00073A459D|nr:PREDICTED: protein CASP-like [Solanum tuberosum]
MSIITLIGAFCNGNKIKNCSTFSIATSGRRITGSEREKAKSSSSSTPLATGEYAEDLGSGFSSDEESNYKKMYEEDINPFAAFSKKERHQRYKELGLRDKITLRSGCFLLGNKMQIGLQLGLE